MKDSLWNLIGILFLLFVAFYSGHSFENGYDAGYDHGYDEAMIECEYTHDDMLLNEGNDDTRDGKAYEAGYDVGFSEGLDEGVQIGFLAIVSKMQPEHREYWCKENADLLANNDMMASVFAFYMSEK